MKYVVEMASGGTIFIPSFIKIGSGVQSGGVGCTYTDKRTSRSSHMPILIFQNKEGRLQKDASPYVTRQHDEWRFSSSYLVGYSAAGCVGTYIRWGYGVDTNVPSI
jgi:hypothetical protein